MSDFLSQDQIDALLQQQSDGGFDIDDVKDGSDDSPESTAGADFDALKVAFELFSEQATTVISTLLNKEVSFSVTECGEMDDEKMKTAEQAPVLSIKIPLEGAVNGIMTAIMGTREVATLSDLMMMGDGSAEYEEDHKDAISEIFNQIIGSFTTALGDKIGDSVSTGTIEVSEYDFSEPFENSHLIIEALSIEEVGDFTFSIAISSELSAQFQEKFKVNAGSNQEFDMGTGDNIGLSSSEIDDLTDMGGDDDLGDLGSSFSSGTSATVNAPDANVNMLLDVPLNISIELGRTNLSIKRILEMAQGAVVELDRMAGEPVDLLVNDKVVARGEVVVVDENFGIRIVSLVSPEERIKSLG